MNATALRIATHLVVLLSFGAVVVGQNTAWLSGVITDQNGKPVPNAKVSLKNVRTEQAIETRSDAEGKYRFNEAASGQYQLSVSADGFTPRILTISASQLEQTTNVQLNASGPSLSDLGFNTAQTQSNPEEQARLDKRAHMLKIHQKMGLITTGPLAATIISGFFAGGKQPSSSTRDLHAALGGTTAALYFTTAYFAIAAPRISGTETRGPIKWHKRLAWIHGTGMVLTPILGAIAFDQKSKGEKVHGIASLHGPVAIITGAAYGAAMLSVSVKF